MTEDRVPTPRRCPDCDEPIIHVAHWHEDRAMTEDRVTHEHSFVLQQGSTCRCGAMTEDTGITRTLFAVAALGLAFWITLILAIFDIGPFR